MVGASARYSCLYTPVETSTPPRRRGLHIVSLPRKLESSLIPSLLRSKPHPLRWAAVW